MNKHFMVDIETLSTAVNAVVLSIGAVEFDPLSGKILREFYRELDLSDQENRHVELNTLRWWFKQCQENPANFDLIIKHNLDKDDVKFALHKLGEFINGGVEYTMTRVEGYERVAVWACDPDFDIAILDNLYEDHNLLSPWRYSELRSVRTIRELIKIADMEVPHKEADHNALNDCIRQAKEVSYFIANLQHDGA